MSQDSRRPSAEGEVAEAFLITGRGWVVAVKEGFWGIIHAKGVIESNTGSASYASVEFLDRRATGEGLVAVMVDQSARAHFRPGQAVRFYQDDRG